ncbi:gonadotropin-releasing hormone II receptor-like [Schistocerca americana]|uniref:gonadotropin-releasing hormone II receptor-like n=1 Tax=Schistocerca americana TaxID=7009 RepID=UPI001F4F33AF|nr:gonadotropin-releasing hormone II receptor-like [Schistocerca americana]
MAAAAARSEDTTTCESGGDVADALATAGRRLTGGCLPAAERNRMRLSRSAGAEGRGRRKAARRGSRVWNEPKFTFTCTLCLVGWRLTTQWVAGDAACKVFLLLRAFGLYLSSNVLVCVSLDRYFAVLHPLKVNDARRRGKIMLVFAWLIAFACSVPQILVLLDCTGMYE